MVSLILIIIARNEAAVTRGGKPVRENLFETGSVNRFEVGTGLVNRFEVGTGLKLETCFLVLVNVFRALEIVGRLGFFLLALVFFIVNKHFELP
ncbi:hypothetical protein BpHYR1_043245 [Brachionus plicatilis]|uniref:Uncharacterized protein n=1 Tax=Brachionus plicatilis TaxID=10195 RepID=A0A3M7R3B5_BRAPC|nr:hypothetical protein BpHYR1_043245 [Brachionus plicatilis]